MPGYLSKFLDISILFILTMVCIMRRIISSHCVNHHLFRGFNGGPLLCCRIHDSCWSILIVMTVMDVGVRIYALTYNFIQTSVINSPYKNLSFPTGLVMPSRPVWFLLCVALLSCSLSATQQFTSTLAMDKLLLSVFVGTMVPFSSDRVTLTLGCTA